MSDQNKAFPMADEQSYTKSPQAAVEHLGRMVAQARVPNPPPTFTFNATDSQAPELVLGYMQANFHRLSDADLYRTLGQAIRLRDYLRAE